MGATNEVEKRLRDMTDIINDLRIYADSYPETKEDVDFLIKRLTIKRR